MKLCQHCHHRFESGSWQCPVCDFSPPSANGFPQFAPELDDTDEGFNTSTFDNLFELESSNFWFRSRNQLITWAIETYFSSAESYLEIGCGTGFVLSAISKQFSQLRCAGSEIHSVGLNRAQTRVGDAPLWQMDARKIPFENEFDLIGAFDVIEHIKEDDTVLSELFRAIRPGGGILLSVPQHPSLWSRVDEQACHERRYTRRELKKKVEDAGFNIVRVTSFVTLLLPLMAASRLKEKFSEANPSAELDLPEILNAVFESIMRLESTFIHAGVNLPVGGSLLLAAKKPE